jgi:hypothetical protein
MAVPGEADAAKVRLYDDSSGGSGPETIDGSSLEVGFNPTVVIPVDPVVPLPALLVDLAEAINLASRGEYHAWVADDASVEIRRSDGTEIDDLRCREDASRLQAVTLSVDRPDLIARIHAPVEVPSAGTILVTLNDRTVAVATRGLRTADAVTQALVRALEATQFQVAWEPPFIVVWRDLLNNSGISVASFRSTDPAIVRSDLSLLPSGSPAAPSP